jgi:uncharacterized repeat protein (TIGR03803 family)
VILDTKGNLYGTTYLGGANNLGSVFEVPAGGGADGPDKILYSFHSADYGATNPLGGLVFDHSGNLYGTTAGGGPYENAYGGGKIFELLPQQDGSWTVRALHDFGGMSYNGVTGIDGYAPEASMVLGPDGNFYGTTYLGGYDPAYSDSVGLGTVFKLVVH